MLKIISNLFKKEAAQEIKEVVEISTPAKPSSMPSSYYAVPNRPREITLDTEKRQFMISVIHGAKGNYGEEKMWNISLEQLNSFSDTYINKLYNDTSYDDMWLA